jgi:MFS superfamily sulfate permease-like transporter
MYRFGSPITFFNAAYFKQRVLAVVDAAGPGVRWVVIDLIPISHVDVTGIYAVRDLRKALQSRGATLMLAGRKTEYMDWLRECGLLREEDEHMFFPTLRQAFHAFQATGQA